MKKPLVLLLFLIIGIGTLTAQSGGRPSWVTHLPEAGNSSYYYRVTVAEARTHEKAYAKAFAMAILESSWKLGVTVDTRNDLQVVEQGILDDISVQDNQMVLPLNKVCEYEERLNSSMNVRLYVLWQVASDGNRKPEFEPYINCN